MVFRIWERGKSSKSAPVGTARTGDGPGRGVGFRRRHGLGRLGQQHDDLVAGALARRVTLRELEDAYTNAVLEATGGNKMEAARILHQQPQSLQLRYLQTLTEIAQGKSSTIVFPLPLDLIEPLLGKKA